MTDTAPADVRPRGSTSPAPVESQRPALPAVGRNEFGTIVIRDDVVAKIAACAAAEIPDAGAAATRVMGRAIPGGGRLGLRATDLEALPKIKAEIDGVDSTGDRNTLISEVLHDYWWSACDSRSGPA